MESAKKIYIGRFIANHLVSEIRSACISKISFYWLA
jgi:hypothetical protein